MSYSLNEIEALAKRAARGAGLSWGMSEEAAKATRWLASHGLPAAGVLADTLKQTDLIDRRDVAPMSLDGVWGASNGVLCPLASGAALNDCAGRLAEEQDIRMAQVSHPLLVVPFAAWAAIHIKAPVHVSWESVQVETDGFGLWIEGVQSDIAMTTSVSLTCSKVTDAGAAFEAPAKRGFVSDAAWAQLNELAHRTYARATEESRMLGAGSGVSDND